MKNAKWILICLLLMGCASTAAVGTNAWYNDRLNELREARLNGQITTEKYLEFKAEADKLRMDYMNQPRVYDPFYYPPTFGYGFGYSYHHHRHH
ncbi:MAG: hypothetical protein KBD53_07135 [Candidatus Omnitrophica bacterium]|nr:hypothetical protein [Candidatus Omnitrophota bacterium]